MCLRISFLSEDKNQFCRMISEIITFIASSLDLLSALKAFAKSNIRQIYAKMCFWEMLEKSEMFISTQIV